MALTDGVTRLKMSYQDNRKWGDMYLDAAIEGLKKRGFQSVDVTCDDIDMEQAADLIGVRGHDEITIAFRVRDYAYFDNYADDFTLRYRHKSGAKTEYEKVMAGHGDWMLYGFGKEGSLVKYALFNLDGVRKRGRQILDISKREMPNKGGNTFFVWFKWCEMPASCLIDSNYVNKSEMVSQENIDWLDSYISESEKLARSYV